ncbi:16S rRNA (cytidine(1402)-2'-O)-methyltransferase [Lactobacillus sp. XV13L]|nr:16S rRNA (cytidine(1402)-2'-O)-methyltransferase [Lactobacillus sp. XV13L]
MKSFTPSKTGCLYLVPTPIGNLDDMSVRAVKTLQKVDLIAAEDTRNTQKLLNHFDIHTKQISFHEHNTQQRLPELIAKLQEGLNLAQVSDAGMPSISDPGQELVAACVQKHITVVPLPGPNAALTALIASGIKPQPFYFYGFLPRKTKAQQEALQKLGQLEATFILYESPYRIKKTVAALSAFLSPQRQVALARELTKIHEAFLRGTLAQLEEYFASHEPRGEYVIIVQGRSLEPTAVEITAEQMCKEIEELVQTGKKPNLAIKTVAQKHQRSRQDVYNIYHGLEEKNE